ncbi:MAG: GNAT family N-acetyltransferase [Clostridia bacterium]|nr:GNAT family N-acetyltransferase [Deltaproteobacteria bacterium]
MMSITIRRAVHADLPILLQFEQGIIIAERPFDATLRDGDVRYYDIPALIDSPTAELLVAEHDGEVIGSGFARIESSQGFLRHTRHAYLGFVYVKPGYRGQRISATILDALKIWIRQQDITEMRLEVYADNTSAITAYTRAGFNRHLIVLRGAVDPE